MKSISAIHPIIMENMENMLMKRVPLISMHESHNASISAMSNSFHNTVNKASASVIFMSRTETITCLLQIVTLRGCEERMGA